MALTDRNMYIFNLDFDMTHDGEECSKKCGVEKKYWGLDWCWTVNGNEKWHYCTPGNHQA